MKHVAYDVKVMETLTFRCKFEHRLQVCGVCVVCKMEPCVRNALENYCSNCVFKFTGQGPDKRQRCERTLGCEEWFMPYCNDCEPGVGTPRRLLKSRGKLIPKTKKVSRRKAVLN